MHILSFKSRLKLGENCDNFNNFVSNFMLVVKFIVMSQKCCLQKFKALLMVDVKRSSSIIFF